MPRHVRSDAPRPWSLLAIAGVAGLVGYGVAHASLDVDRAALAAERGAEHAASGHPEPAALDGDSRGDAPAADGLPAESSADSTAPSEDEAAPNDPADGGGDRPVEEAATPVPAIVPPPAASEPELATPGGSSHVEMGRVAYIRCDGLPSPSDVCPRDHAVERRVWEAVQSLAQCPAARGLVGNADLRVVFDGGRFSGIGFRDFDRDALDTDALRGCLEGRLRELRTAHPATRYTASFRFSLAR